MVSYGAFCFSCCYSKYLQYFFKHSTKCVATSFNVLSVKYLLFLREFGVPFSLGAAERSYLVPSPSRLTGEEKNTLCLF